MIKIADIFISDKDRTKVFQLPILPERFPEFSRAAKNEEFETWEDGVYTLIGNVDAIKFSLECWLPGMDKEYSFAKSKINPYDLINLMHNAMLEKNPIRYVANRNPNLKLPVEITNMLVTVESLSWYEDRLGDVQYKVDFKEYREIT
ncbi:hypothetical protein [Clostridium magnum]|uniref:Uncharacterized protein n=1 Tax=Clostridium magnum DSM 2767 TaxID=1121326 RepID=A0A161Y5N5_9CLOT|nr:hypothetical protein [Clostridium magnum]KZL93559.1 hypothetical protein CLMAG_06050 [Clostridium magnum DSM 2767]SHI60503.1 hypothetical protein SAMN02745944_04571 [Clostridium magnum DSM 2767]